MMLRSALDWLSGIDATEAPTSTTVNATPDSDDEDYAENINLYPEDYVESSKPLGPAQSHLLNLVSKNLDKATQKAPTNAASSSKASSSSNSKPSPPPRTKIFCCCNVYEVREISMSEGSFTVRIRIYLLWRPNLKGDDNRKRKVRRLMRQAREDGHYVNLNNEQVTNFLACVDMPTIKFFNAHEIDEIDAVPSIRAYVKTFIGFIFISSLHNLHTEYCFSVCFFSI